MSGRTRVVQIVPRLGPYDGVGDYALGLARELRDRHGLGSVFIETGTRRGEGVIAEFETHRAEAGSAAALAGALAQAGGGTPGARVLLHYVGYGYAARGAPLWLARAIRRSRRDLRYRLAVVFHELFASGRPWQSSFWLCGVQQHVVRRLARECDGALLTREGNRSWLQRTGLLAGKPVEVLAVPSTVGEPPSHEGIEARRPSLVVWGGEASKRVVYGRYWPRVRAACEALGVRRIDDIGARADRYPDVGPRVEAHGRLPATEVSTILGGSRFGLIVYPEAFLAKSSQFAACAAHGVVPVVLGEHSREPADGLLAGRHFLRLGEGLATQGLEAVSRAVQAWYSGHTTARHGAAVSAMLGFPP